MDTRQNITALKIWVG